ncbi:YkvA family protein [Pseudomonas sp. LRF_L74]|uniref:YkvA family protein n=1 Tax=Pseudomonas sp. LRF_L74 TaxID=3369422 RepID=UPI003F603256
MNMKRYLENARTILARGRLPALLLAVASKRAARGDRQEGLGEKLRLLQGLCAAWLRGEYRQINPQALLAVVAGLLYFLTPLDLVPDWLLGVGLLDDLAVLAWVMRTWQGELDAYRTWRDAHSQEELAVIERVPEAS